MSAHRSAAKAFNETWENWLDKKNRRTKIKDTKAWRRMIENRRIKIVSVPRCARTYQCPNSRQQWLGTS